MSRDFGVFGVLGLIVVAPLLLLLGGCINSSQKVALEPVLSVNEHTLSVKEFSRQIAHHLKDLDALAAKDPNNVVRAKETLISQFIINSLIKDYANERGLKVSDDLLEKEVKSYRALYPDDLSFRKILAEEGLSLSEWRAGIKDRILERLVFSELNKNTPEPGRDDLMAIYESQKEGFK